jgi:hypothetical protein
LRFPLYFQSILCVIVLLLVVWRSWLFSQLYFHWTDIEYVIILIHAVVWRSPSRICWFIILQHQKDFVALGWEWIPEGVVIFQRLYCPNPY